MSSNKRPADTYLTKEPERNRPAEDIDDDRDVIDPVQLASDEVMATRKVAKPRRSRFPQASTEQNTRNGNNGVNGGAGGGRHFAGFGQQGNTAAPPSTAGGGLFSGITSTATWSFQAPSLSAFSGSGTTTAVSTTSVPPIKPFTGFSGTTSTSPIPPSAAVAEEKPSDNPFASLKPSAAPTKPLFPPSSPFSKFPPVAPSSFTPDMASQKPPSKTTAPARSGPIRTPRHSFKDSAPPPSTFPPHHPALSSPNPATTVPLTTLSQQQPASAGRTTRALVKSNGDNVPIATPDRNPTEPPEKHYWERIKAMNEAFSEAVARSIDGDAYCNLEWLFGQYKYWREEIERGYPYNPAIDSPAPSKSSSTSRLEDLKSGITMKPPTPQKEIMNTLFIRSQAPPPETQVLPSLTQSKFPWETSPPKLRPEESQAKGPAWEGSTQSTERTRESQQPPRASKTASTILGILDSSSSLPKGSEPTKFSFERPARGAEKPVAPIFGGDMSKPFTFGEGSKLPASAAASTTATDRTVPILPGALSSQRTTDKERSSFFGAAAPKPTSTTTHFSFARSTMSKTMPEAPLVKKPFGAGSTFVTPTTTSLPTAPSFGKPSSPAKPVEKSPSPPKSTNRFQALGYSSLEKDIITIDSDEEMPAEEAPEEEMQEELEEPEEEMGIEVEEPEEEMEAEVEEPEEEMADEDEEPEEEMGDEEGGEEGDDVRDTDYIVLEDEEEVEEVEEEPLAEEVAKEVPSLIGTETEPTAKPPASSTPTVPDQKNEADLPKPPPISENPFAKYLVSQQTLQSEPSPEEKKSVFRFGLPTGPSTFKPAETTPLPTEIKGGFKFGLQPPVTEKNDEEGEQLRRSPRLKNGVVSTTTEEGGPGSPRKRGRSASPKKEDKTKKVEGPTEEKPVEKTTTEDAKPLSFLPTTAKPFTFGAGTSDYLAGDQSKSLAFGSASGEQSKSFAFGTSTTSTPFTFGATSSLGQNPFSTFSATVKQSDASKPYESTTSKSFNFDVPKKDFTWTPDKPIKFDTPTQSKPPSFSQSASRPFSFGGLSTPVPAAPKFPSTTTFSSTERKFGAFTDANTETLSPNLGFSFGQPSSAPEKDADDTTDQADEGGEDAPPVVDGEVGREGEENEETIFSERAKLIQRLSVAESKAEARKTGGEVKRDRDYGVGVVRVNVHKETKKGRILFRLEGSGRVILNSYLVPGVDYVKQGKSMVMVPSPRSDGTGFDTYFVRVKEASAAERLAKTLQENRNIS